MHLGSLHSYSSTRVALNPLRGTASCAWTPFFSVAQVHVQTHTGPE